MDLETRISLRTVTKPEATTLVKMITVVSVIHMVVIFYLNIEEPQSVAQLPDWVNIKLIAGYEENQEKNSSINDKTISSKVENTELRKMSKQELEDKNIIKKNEQIKKAKEKKSSTSSATTTIKASSRPFNHENPKPVYPAIARRRGMQGVVLLGVEVSANGLVEKIDILQSSGFKILDNAAIQSVKEWHFIPGSIDGINTASRIKIPVRFSLQQSES